MKKIAVVGVGIMGAGIASNFLKNGYQVFVWNRGKDRTEPLVAKGAVVAETPKEAALQADIVFEVTASDESSRAVWLGDEGILAGARPDQLLISSGTLSAGWVDELAALCAKKGFAYFDIMLTGGRPAAESGKLLMLAGGDENKFAELLPDLKAISAKVVRFGPVGSGARYKLILNVLQSVHMQGLAEALKLAAKEGMDLQKVGDELAEYPGGIVTARSWQNYQHPPSPINFALKWVTKDVRYAKELAGDLDLPLLNDVLAKYNEAMEKGKGEDDWTSVAKI
jgi:3-hydroxyisobutyrate dehydrogenase-like beta-hydroxyacid dehydrogenase